MRVETTDFKKGDVVVVTAGEYSDYRDEADFVVLKDFNIKAVGWDYLDEHPRQKLDYKFKRTEFLAWLCAQGYTDDIGVHTPELYMGDYGKHPFGKRPK
jgi:hypothetical protein